MLAAKGRVGAISSSRRVRRFKTVNDLLTKAGSMFFEEFSAHSDVSELVIIRYEKSLTSVEPSSLLGFFEVQLKKTDALVNEYMRNFLLSFILSQE